MGNPGDQFLNAVQSLTREAMRRQHDAIEEMCERMLTQQGTDYGILVETHTDLDSFTTHTTVTLSPEVPFGEIHYKTGDSK